MDQHLVDFIEWSVNLSFWSSVLFPLVIASVWPWWKDWFGQTMVAFDLTYASAALSTVMYYDWGLKGTVLVWVAAIGLATSFLVLIWRTIVIFHEQRKAGPR